MDLLKRLIPAALWNRAKQAAANVSWQQSGPRIERLEAAVGAPLESLRSRVTDLEVEVEQVRAILRHDAIPPPPPRHLQVRTVGGFVPGFIESGFSICEDLDGVLSTIGRSIRDFPRVLDWGCGCGRTARAFATLVPEAELHGIDIDAEAIRWLKRCYARYGSFEVSPAMPPTAFPDGHFDLIFGISVFTHLPEDMQLAWLEELRRITRPGGHLVMTTSGEKNYGQLPAEMRQVVERQGFLYVDTAYGQGIGLPAFYQNAFHSMDYVRRVWGRLFRVLDQQPARLQTFLDTTLLRREP